jgi:hypothetical protein
VHGMLFRLQARRSSIITCRRCKVYCCYAIPITDSRAGQLLLVTIIKAHMHPPRPLQTVVFINNLTREEHQQGADGEIDAAKAFGKRLSE